MDRHKKLIIINYYSISNRLDINNAGISFTARVFSHHSCMFGEKNENEKRSIIFFKYFTIFHLMWVHIIKRELKDEKNRNVNLNMTIKVT